MLGINKSSHTPISLDIESFYPSVTFRLLQKVVTFYARKLSLKDKLVVHQCLKTIHFGMANCLLQFGDKWFEYDGEKDVLDKGLTIGGYKLAWLADLVAAYIMYLRRPNTYFSERRSTVFTMTNCLSGYIIMLKVYIICAFTLHNSPKGT
jgi:hypothetical protein